MARIDIVVSNDRHHWAMMEALARHATRRGHHCRVLSLCEFRGIATPPDTLDDGRIPVLRISRVHRPQASKGSGVGSKGNSNRLFRSLAWHLFLAGNMKKALAARPDVVLLFNDAAYPYDRICRMLRSSDIPFVLIQEGIRYDVADSAQEGSLNQGRGDANAIAAWGESSAEYFVRQGAPEESIRLTGNPRFDEIGDMDLQARAESIRRELGLRGRTLLFLSNPIEFHGYCTVSEKLELVRNFILGLDPLFDDPEFRVIVKLHSHEDPNDFREAAGASAHRDRILIVSNYELYPLLTLADGAVIFSTTAGLEAVLLGVPLGVVDIPGVGYLHDFVAGGAALPLGWREPMADQVGRLLAAKGRDRPEVQRYLDRTLALRKGATEAVIDLAEEVLADRSAK